MRCAWTGKPIGYGRERHIRSCPACRYARRQWLAAMDGQADGQCLHCGAWRQDGRPPLDHPQWCDSPAKERWGLDTTVRHIVVVTEREPEDRDQRHALHPPSPYVTLLGEGFSDPT